MSFQDKVTIVSLIGFGLIGLYLFISIERRITRDEKRNTANHEARMEQLWLAREADEAYMASLRNLRR